MSKMIQPPESIYNLIPKEEVKVVKPPRYISTFREQVKQEKQLNKSVNRTMGPAQVDMPSPDKYLLKHAKEPKLPEKKPFSYECDENLRKARVPARTEQPLLDFQTNRNFVKRNAIMNIMAVPPKPQPIYADTKHGDQHLLENSGLVLKYTNKKDYGETPVYLQEREEELRKAQEAYDNYVKERMKEGAMKQLCEEERQNILQGLKKNWDELHHQYQGLSLFTDTIPKKHKKLRLELEMKQLEKDIDLFQRFKIIYISND